MFAYRYDRYGADDMTEYLRAYARRFPAWGVEDNGRINYPECAHAVRRPAFRGCARRGRTLRFEYAAAEGERFGDAGVVVLYVTVPEDDSPVRVRVELRGKRATPYVESGALSLPLPAAKRLLDQQVRRRDRPGGGHRARREPRLLRAGTLRRGGGRGRGGRRGQPRLPAGEPWRERRLRLSPRIRAPRSGNALLPVQQHVGHNFPQWIEGDMAFEFDVFSETSGAIAEIYARACELAENPDGGQAVELPFALSAGLRAVSVRLEGGAVRLCLQSCAAERIEARIARAGLAI